MRLFLIACTLLLLGSCNKEPDFNYPPGTVGISRITVFPTLTLKGSNIIVVPKGGTFTDPGVTAKEGATDIQYTTSGTVNVNTPGVYQITYTAFNKDNFSATARRTVVVYSTDASAAANDLSGKYLRAATGQLATWTKLAPGVYYIDNPGGAAGVNLQVIAFNPTGFTVFIPTQISSDGNTSSSSNFNYVNGNPPSYTLVFLNPGYGTGVRSFVKQ
jgi:hypothetical protein